MTGRSAARNYKGEHVNIQREVQVVSVKRNPYLVDYQQHRKECTKILPMEAERNGNRSSEGKKQVSANNSRKSNKKSISKRVQRRRKLFIRRGIVLVACTLILWFTISGSITMIAKAVNAIQSWNDSDSQVSSRKGSHMEQQVDETQLIQGLTPADYGRHPTWTADFLTPNEYSRPGEALEEVNSIFVHYTANAGTSAAQNRSYFEQQKDTHERSVSAHFIIGYEGEIIQCVPLDEIAYAVQTRNYDSISIECCYLKDDGSFTQETYDSLIELLQWLVDVYDLDVDEDILRHYDCGGKKCPIYYTENEDAWERLKGDVKTL